MDGRRLTLRQSLPSLDRKKMEEREGDDSRPGTVSVISVS